MVADAAPRAAARCCREIRPAARAAGAAAAAPPPGAPGPAASRRVAERRRRRRVGGSPISPCRRCDRSISAVPSDLPVPTPDLAPRVQAVPCLWPFASSLDATRRGAATAPAEATHHAHADDNELAPFLCPLPRQIGAQF